jgi:hypothetical protein
VCSRRKALKEKNVGSRSTRIALFWQCGQQQRVYSSQLQQQRLHTDYNMASTDCLPLAAQATAGLRPGTQVLL